MKMFDSIKNIKGIGEKTTLLFNRVGIETLEDLIHYYPRTYARYENPVSLQDADLSMTNSFKLQILNDFNFEKKRSLVLGSGFATDGKDRVYIVIFNMPYLKNKLKKGNTYIFSGKLLKNDKNYKLEQPLIFDCDEYENLKKTLQPVYSLTKGLSNKTFIKALQYIFESYSSEDEFLPSDVINEYNLISTWDAYRKIHFPMSDSDYFDARKRLSFNELFSFILGLKLVEGLRLNKKTNMVMLETSGPKMLCERLPYRLTKAQQHAFEEVCNDMTGGYLMNRMIQGDVGSGKTIVSFLAALLCVENAYQCCIMAPTELLAEQHYKNLINLTDEYNLPFTPVLLTGSLTKKNKESAYEKILKGESNIVIGTHAVFQEGVEFNNLGLVITDEQHRFGVKQREALAKKGKEPHILVMSATPIPRSLAMVLYGDMHLTVIDEKPSNRLPIKNCVVGTDYRPKAYSFIEKEIRAGHQAYVVCPMVEESDGLENVENVISYTEKLKHVFSGNINISYLHGKMKPAEKQKIMTEFLNKNIDILVSTTVIEVGIDVPNATVIMVENAERFGLSQLHQLRGRIGRGAAQSYTIFINSSKNSAHNKRLDILNKTNDGFEVAREDLKLRGAGDIFGIRQSGDMNFEIADIIQDGDMILSINKTIENIIKDDPEFKKTENERLINYMKEGNNKLIDFSTI